MKIRNLFIFIVACVALMGSSLAFADPSDVLGDFVKGPVPKYNLQFFRPAPNPGDYLTTYGAAIDDSDWRITGGVYFNYAHVPMDISYSDTKAKKAILYSQTYMDLFASVSLFQWAEIALSLPVILVQKTDFHEKEFPLHKVNNSGGAGDLRLVVKGKALDVRQYNVGLAFILDMSLPTGNENKLMGDDTVTFALLAALEFNPWGKTRMAFNLGYRYRPHQYIYGYDMGQSFILSGAFSMPFFHKDLDFLADMRGEITVDSANKSLSSDERPFEADFAFRYRFFDNDSWYRGFGFTAGVGAGIDSVGAADLRVFLGLSFHWVNGGTLNNDFEAGGYLTEVEPCPDPELTPRHLIPERCIDVKVDSDNDTIPDSKDRCPFVGRVGFIDADGCAVDSDGDTVPDYSDLCPDEGGIIDVSGCPRPIDSDGDTIMDDVDKCPKEPETVNGFEDEDGCPDVDPDALVMLTDGKIDIKEQVFFETGKDIIKPESYELLGQVAELINDNPHIGNISIEGHTDSKGNYKKNMKLSQERADAVMQFLIIQGVDPDRLNAVGYGPDRPIDTNKTEEGRARNRRVEFVVMGLSEEQSDESDE